MNYVRAIRKDKLKLSQAELGEHLGVTQATISRIENDLLPLDSRTTLALEALVARAEATTAPAHSASATNLAEIICPPERADNGEAAEEAAPRPFAHSSPTCSPTSGHAAPPQGSLACSTGEAEAA